MFVVIINDLYLEIYREMRKHTLDDDRKYHWREILGVIIPACSPKLIDKDDILTGNEDATGRKEIFSRANVAELAVGKRAGTAD